MVKLGEEDQTTEELSKGLLHKNPLSTKANFLVGLAKGGTDKALQAATSEHVEVTCRITLVMFIAYILMFADIRWITPINQSFGFGLLVPFIAMLFPTLMFCFGSLTLPIFSIFLTAMASSTMLMAIAAAGGDGWFEVSFIIFAFWISFLRWDKLQGAKVSLILIGVVFNCVLIFPTYKHVIDGFVVPGRMMGFLTEATAAAVALGAGTHDIMVESGVLEGRMAVITVNDDGTTSAFLEGGMWLVTGAWTFSGINNPLAKYQNTIINTVWMIVVLAIIPLLPPFRTMRSAVWRGMIPGAMMDAAALIRAHVDKVEKENSLTAAADGSLDEARGKIGQQLGKAVYHMNALNGGNVAAFTFFEPRMLDCKPVECTGGYLMYLSMITASTVSAAAGIALFTNRDFLYHNMDQYLTTAKNLETCAKALAIGNISILDGVDLNNDGDHDSFKMHQRTVEIVGVSRKWLGAMSGEGGSAPPFCSMEAMRAFKTNLKPWIDVHFTHLLNLVQYILALFKKSTWKSLSDKNSYAKIKCLWCLKFALGMGILVIMTIHWPEYRLGITVGVDDPVLKQRLAAANGGWVLIAYCFATTQTAEGSVKKGMMRMAGTVIGAFYGWLATLACENDSFKSASNKGFNTYGLIAWMTIGSALATYISTERGFLARVSLAADYSFGPIYFVVTLIVVIWGVVGQFGPDARGEVTVNRMFANLFGIAMSTITNVIPPGNYGGDPGHTKKINDFHWRSVQSFIEKACSLEGVDNIQGTVSMEDLASTSNDIKKTSAKLLDLVGDYHADAARMQKVPFFRVDPMLKMYIGLVTRDSHVVSFLPRLLSNILDQEDSRKLLVEKGGVVQKKFQGIRDDMRRGGILAPDPRTAEFHLPPSELIGTRDDIDLLIKVTEWLVGEIRSRDHALKRVEWGAFSGLMGPIKN